MCRVTESGSLRGVMRTLCPNIGDIDEIRRKKIIFPGRRRKGRPSPIEEADTW